MNRGITSAPLAFTIKSQLRRHPTYLAVSAASETPLWISRAATSPVEDAKKRFVPLDGPGRTYFSDMDRDLKYPIGKWSWPTEPLTDAERRAAIRAIAETPHNVRAAVKGLSEKQLDTSYRPGGWTVRQVVHHLPDSHLNAYTRFKLALTEDSPVIKPYDESAWAELADGKGPQVSESLSLLESLHARWVFLLERMQPSDFQRPLRHPEHDRKLTLDMMLAMYAWHGKHHTAHITRLREREKF